MFDIIFDAPTTPSQDKTEGSFELVKYLATPVNPDVKDPLRWWWDHRFEYPRLSRVGRDYLSIPRTFILFLFYHLSF